MIGLIQGMADTQPPIGFQQRLAYLIVDLFMNDQPTGGSTALPSGTYRPEHHRRQGHLTIIDANDVSHDVDVNFSGDPFNIDPQAGPTYYSYVQRLYSLSPLTFNTDQINKPKAIEDAAYSDTIAVNITNPDFDDVLTYSKISGRDWLDVAANGDLTGTPDDSHVGTNSFGVRVTDASGFSDEATLNITVQNLYDGQWGLADFAGFAASWLNTNCGLCNGADLDGDNDVTMNDLCILGEMWLTGGLN